MSRESISKAVKTQNTWEPEIGDVLYGEVVSITTINFSDGRASKLITVRDDVLGVLGVWMKAVLERQCEELGVMRGDTIGIKYLGKPPGKQYYDYIVEKEQHVPFMDEGDE